MTQVQVKSPAAAGAPGRPAAAARPPAPAGGLSTQHAPSIGLPLGFVLTGLLSFVVGVVWLALRPDILATYHYNQYVLAVTHVVTLGFISSIVMGSLYQLVPVALEVPLFSERLGRWHFPFHLVGVIGMVASFWVWDVNWVGYFGSVAGVGMMLFVYNLGRTLARLPRWNWIAWGVASALFWLTATLLAGLYVAASKRWPLTWFEPLAQMHAHAHLGALGFFTLLIITLSYKLVPMFTLSELQSPRRATLSIALLNISLLGLFVALLRNSPWKLAFALGVVTALAVYGAEIHAILRARKRRQLDWGLRSFLTALALYAPLAVLAVVLCWPRLPATEFTAQLENVYGFVGLLGVVGFAIQGMLYKIVPFLVWFARYSPDIGRRPVPALADLYSTRLQVAGYWTFVGGLLATSLATALAHEKAVQVGCLVLAVSLLLFVFNMSLIFSHFVRPRRPVAQTASNRTRQTPPPTALVPSTPSPAPRP